MREFLRRIHKLLFDRPVYLKDNGWVEHRVPVIDKRGRQWLVKLETSATPPPRRRRW